MGLPFIGYLPFVNKLDPYVHKAMKKLAEIHGPVTGFYLGPFQPFISVCGYEAVKEALHNEDLNGRPSSGTITERTFGKKLGIMFTDGDFLREQRRFTLRHLRDLGFGRTSSENLIHEEIHELIEEIKISASSHPDSVVDFKALFNPTLINILWAFIAGKRYKHNDEELNRLLHMVDLFVASGNNVRSNLPIPAVLLRNFPILKKIIGLRTDMFVPIQNFIRAAIDEHEENPSEDDPRDFIDVYLSEAKKHEKVNPVSTFHKEQLISLIFDLFIAGGDTTGNSIGFVLLYLIHHPDVQRKMQEELDSVCGSSMPTLAQRPSLPYTEAVLLEASRLSSIVPFSIPHYALKDTQLQGSTIPKGSIVQINLYSVHLDEKYWNDPEEFQPERHLSADGTTVIKSDRILPFGAGKRMCLGESLARNTLYLFVTSLVKSFQFQAIPNEPLPTLDPRMGFVQVYAPFKAVIKSRN
ncbi:methyl farnesoate epoxidase-like isoform X2 [Daphnia pulicaria]|nr:methyl farnesoate epoxidase-like isoform X2 [Daphnia pulicaria]